MTLLLNGSEKLIHLRDGVEHSFLINNFPPPLKVSSLFFHLFQGFEIFAGASTSFGKQIAYRDSSRWN